MDPAVIEYRKSPLRPLAAGLLCLVFGAASAVGLWQEASPTHAIILAVFVLGSAYCAVLALGLVKDRSDTLRLDSLGFGYRDHGLERRIHWRDVASPFRPLRLFYRTVIVWTTDGSDPPKGFYGYLARAGEGTVEIMPGDYHWSPYLLARHLNRARARALRS